MDEKTVSTLERIQQAALDEFSEKRIPGRFPAPDREKRRSDHRGLLRLLFQQRSPVRFHRGTPCRRPYGQVYGSPDFLRGTARRTAAGSHGRRIHGLRPLDGGLYLPAPGTRVKLLLSRSEGTSYEHFVHNMVEVEVEYTLKYMDVLRRLGAGDPRTG